MITWRTSLQQLTYAIASTPFPPGQSYTTGTGATCLTLCICLRLLFQAAAVFEVCTRSGTFADMVSTDAYSHCYAS